MIKEHTEGQKESMEVIKIFLLKFLNVIVIIKDMMDTAGREYW